MFFDFLRNNGFTKSRNKKIFNANLKRFSNHLLEQSSDCPLSDPYFDYQDFTVYVGVLLNINLMKKLAKKPADNDKIEEFNDLLYSYSHQRFYDLVSKIEVSELIKSIITTTGLDSFISSHQALAANRQAYTEHIQRMIENI